MCGLIGTWSVNSMVAAGQSVSAWRRFLSLVVGSGGCIANHVAGSFAGFAAGASWFGSVKTSSMDSDRCSPPGESVVL